MIKISGNPQNNITFYKIPDPVLLKTSKVIKSMESLRNCHSPKEPKETLQLHMMTNISWVGCWNIKEN